MNPLMEVADQIAYLREQNLISGFDIWLRVSSAGASFMLLEPSTKVVAFISPPVDVTSSREFRAALNSAIVTAKGGWT